MKFISHRGNLNGARPDLENNPSQIEEVIGLGYDCEIDIWYIDGKIFLGHDEAQYLIDSSFLRINASRLWVHCKNVEALLWCQNSQIKNLNYFWHQEDKVTLTSLRFVWAYPGFQPIDESVAVMPEINNETQLTTCIGICSDIIEIYRKNYGKI